jgi:hypothetical protein
MKTFIAVALTGAANAWWESGHNTPFIIEKMLRLDWTYSHLLTARRAYDILETNNPDALQAANDMLESLKRHYPSITTNEKNYPFVECATFADVIKGKGYTW